MCREDILRISSMRREKLKEKVIAEKEIEMRENLTKGEIHELRVKAIEEKKAMVARKPKEGMSKQELERPTKQAKERAETDIEKKML